MTYFNVKDGTHAGWRKVNAAPLTAWFCCGVELAKHWAKCPTCSAPRP